MSNPYVGEIRMFAGNFAPVGWALCNGALMPISENEPLFSLIGTTYGGDGQNTFALPNLQSRVPIHAGTIVQNGTASTYSLGQTGGEESVTLTTSQMPAHNHILQVLSGPPGNTGNPSNAVLAVASPQSTNMYSNVPPIPGMLPTVQMAAGALSSTGGSQPHENRPPFLVINFILSLFGIYPSAT